MDRRAFTGQVRLAGPFQQLVLLALIRLGRDTNATCIRRHLMHVTHRRISLTAVHTTLGRLARKGYAYTWKRKNFGNPLVGDYLDRDRRGPAGTCRNIRRFFRVTTWGRRAVRLTLAALESMLPGLPGFSREHELFSWRSLPDPNPKIDRILKRLGRRLGSIEWVFDPNSWR
ncbi:MAG TPA: hypothetical protein VFF36_05890 [Planctomycetota bacterium]|nr:hypothetical protein [Planctomycetota bacterium]